jgi:hypothetical protein
LIHLLVKIKYSKLYHNEGANLCEALVIDPVNKDVKDEIKKCEKAFNGEKAWHSAKRQGGLQEVIDIAKSLS